MTTWAADHIAALSRGQTVQFRPKGNSMRGRVADGALCTVEPRKGIPGPETIVLCTVRDRDYLHLVKKVVVTRGKHSFLIGNNVGGTNGWIGLEGIHGVCVKVES